MKLKFSILLFLCFFMIASVPSFAQVNTTEIKQENSKENNKSEEPKGPPVEVSKDEIGLIITENGTMVQTEDESIKILTEKAAKEYSKVVRFYTATEQKFRIDFARVIKKDKTIIDITKDPESIASKDFPPLKDSPLYKNLRGVILDFGNLEVGDTIEYRVLITDLQPYPNKAFWMTSMSRDISTLKNSKVLFTCPENTSFNYVTYRQKDSKMPLTKKTSKGIDNYSITFKNVPAFKEEIAMPPIASISPKVMISSFKNWSDLSNMINELLKEKLSLSEKMTKDLKFLESESTKKGLEDKIYNLIKNSKSVVHVGYGLGGYRFNKASDIYQQKKISSIDSAVLLCSLYKQAGIDAKIALVASNTIGNISKELPSVQQFDTVLVVIPQQDGKYKWLDPSYRSTFAGELPQELNDSDAMIVDNSGTLTKTPKTMAYKNREEIKGEVSLLADGNADAVINCDFFGTNAISWTGLYNQLNDIQRQNLYKVIAQRTAPNANVLNSGLSVPKTAEEPFSVFVRYISFTMAKKVENNRFECALPILKGGDMRKIIQSNLLVRESPVFIGTPCQEDRSFRINLPEGVKVVEIPKQINIDNNVGSFQIICDKTDKTIYYHSRLVLKKSMVEKEEFKDLEDILKVASNSVTDKIILTGITAGKR